MRHLELTWFELPIEVIVPTVVRTSYRGSAPYILVLKLYIIYI